MMTKSHRRDTTACSLWECCLAGAVASLCLLAVWDALTAVPL